MNRELGNHGENTAVRYLAARGFEILARNFYTRYGEIDIICRKDGTLVFVEVKTRKSLTFGTAEESITRKKIEHLRKAASIYLQQQGTYYADIRFDVVTIQLMDNNMSINHIKNAF